MPVSESVRVLSHLAILLVLAALAAATAVALFMLLGRVESRAHWDREAGIARSRRLERRAFLITAVVVAVLAATGLTLYVTRTPPCQGRVVILAGPGGAPLECLCEEGQRGACFDPGP
jgi:formate hydrogenlyase subunit 3/multisubunit Na+/H+ antiporter MnhD subunit